MYPKKNREKIRKGQEKDRRQQRRQERQQEWQPTAKVGWKRPDRRFWLAAALILGFMGAVMVYSASLENASFDESLHIYAGYNPWRNGDYSYSVGPPPLSRLLAGLALLPLDPWLPQSGIHRKTGSGFVASQPFLYANRVKPDVLLFRGRLPMIVFTLLFELLIAIWTHRHFGPAAALLALFLFALDPNIIAHGRYVTTDMAAAALLFLTVIAWDRFLRTRRTSDLAGAGVVLGLALCAKFSPVVIPALIVILYGVRWWRTEKGLGLVHLVKSMTGVLVIAGCVVGLMYFPGTVTMLQRESDHPIHAW